MAHGLDKRRLRHAVPAVVPARVNVKAYGVRLWVVAAVLAGITPSLVRLAFEKLHVLARKARYHCRQLHVALLFSAQRLDIHVVVCHLSAAPGLAHGISCPEGCSSDNSFLLCGARIHAQLICFGQLLIRKCRCKHALSHGLNVSVSCPAHVVCCVHARSHPRHVLILCVEHPEGVGYLPGFHVRRIAVQLRAFPGKRHLAHVYLAGAAVRHGNPHFCFAVFAGHLRNAVYLYLFAAHACALVRYLHGLRTALCLSTRRLGGAVHGSGDCICLFGISLCSSLSFSPLQGISCPAKTRVHNAAGQCAARHVKQQLSEPLLVLLGRIAVRSFTIQRLLPDKVQHIACAFLCSLKQRLFGQTTQKCFRVRGVEQMLYACRFSQNFDAAGNRAADDRLFRVYTAVYVLCILRVCSIESHQCQRSYLASGHEYQVVCH